MLKHIAAYQRASPLDGDTLDTQEKLTFNDPCASEHRNRPPNGIKASDPHCTDGFQAEFIGDLKGYSADTCACVNQSAEINGFASS